jgi:hypothetical protein
MHYGANMHHPSNWSCPRHLTMEDAKGQVAITLSLGTETEVDIVTHGQNQEVKAFLQRIG